MTNRKKYLYCYLILLIGLILTVGAAFRLGSVPLSIAQLLEGLAGRDATASIILKGIRLPRILAAGLAGMALACAGTILQCVTGNDLCAPNIIGINSGAGFAVILLLCAAPSMWRLLPAAAFVGALCATGFVMGFAFYGGNRSAGTTIVLAGVAVSSILSAGISFLSLRFPDVLTSYTAFSVGGFAGISPDELTVPAIFILLSLVITQFITPGLNTLCLGDEIAASLGVRVKALRILALVLASALCASAVSFAGLLGFVGLIVPHIVRRICGNDIRFNLSLSALFGSILVILSDTIGRTAFAPSELPAGIIMSLLGAPFFLYLLIRQKCRACIQ